MYFWTIPTPMKPRPLPIWKSSPVCNTRGFFRLVASPFSTDSLLGLHGSVIPAKLTYIGIPKQEVRIESKRLALNHSQSLCETTWLFTVILDAVIAHSVYVTYPRVTSPTLMGDTPNAWWNESLLWCTSAMVVQGVHGTLGTRATWHLTTKNFGTRD